MGLGRGCQLGAAFRSILQQVGQIELGHYVRELVSLGTGQHLEEPQRWGRAEGHLIRHDPSPPSRETKPCRARIDTSLQSISRGYGAAVESTPRSNSAGCTARVPTRRRGSPHYLIWV